MHGETVKLVISLVSILQTVCNLANTNVKLPENDIEISKHVVFVHYINRYSCDIYLCIGWLK